MKTTVVTIAEVIEQGTLNAEYWCNREPGETYPAYLRRRQADKLEWQAVEYMRRAYRLMERVSRLRGEAT